MNLKLFNDGKNIIVNEGGQHSSKTYSILQLIITLAYYDKCKRVYTIVGESLPFLKTGAIRQFLEILHSEDLYNENNWNQTEHIYKFTNSIVEFKAYDLPSKALGAKRDYLFINEAINLPYETYINLESRTNICTFLDYNPSFQYWVHDKLLNSNRNDVGFVHSTYKDNKFLPEKIIKTIERYKDTDPNRWKVMGEGKLGSNDGLVFSNWDIVDEFKGSDKTSFGMDFGFTNDPSTCIGVYMSDGELYVDEVMYGIGMTTGDIKKRCDDEEIGRKEIVADSADPRTIDDLKKRGLNIYGCTKGSDSINSGIDTIKQYKLHISRRSINLIKELRNYSWLKDKNGNLINKTGGLDHCLDALRYVVSEKFSVGQKKPTKIRIMN